MNAHLCVRYSVSQGRQNGLTLSVRQLEASIRSLRQLDDSIPIFVFSYGGLSSTIEATLRDLGVCRQEFGRYYFRLARLVPPRVARVLSEYPPLHKFLDLNHPSLAGFDHLLQVDCDTLFFHHPDRLVQLYGDSDLAARAEVSTIASPSGGDPEYIDEDRLQQLMKEQGCRRISPFNSGAALLSKSGRKVLGRRESLMLDYAWRFVTWMACHRVASTSRFGESRLVQLIRSSSKVMTEHDLSRMLEYPSANRWLLDEFTQWMACGTRKALRVELIAPRDIGLGSEMLALNPPDIRQVLHHYFSCNTEAVAAWLHSANRGSERKKSTTSAPSIAHRRISSSQKKCFRTKGFLLIDNVQFPVPIAALREEAQASYRSAIRQRLDFSDNQEGRGGRPPRRFCTAGGGPVLEQFCRSESVPILLRECCGRSVIPTGSNGSYSYYVAAGDFMGLHLDVNRCDLVIITCLRDDSDPLHAGGALAIYPSRRAESIAAINASPFVGIEVIKLRPGQSIIFAGGSVPHRVLPVSSGQNRVISVICFRLL